MSLANISQNLADAEIIQRVFNPVPSAQDTLSNKQNRCRICGAHWSDQGLVIETEGARPAWLERAEARMTSLLQLTENWDSYGASAVDPTRVVDALRLVLDIIGPNTPAPAFVPTRSGGVQFEWHENGIDLEVEVESPFECGVYLLDGESGDEYELTLRHDLSRLVEFVNKLSIPRPRFRSAG